MPKSVTEVAVHPTHNPDPNTWEDNAGFWVQIIRGKHDRYRTGLTDVAILDAIGPVDSLRVLDAGCGEGYLSRELAARGATVVGVDSSAKLIEAASALVPDRSSTLSFQVNDVAQMQLAGDSFDLVACNHLMNDLPDPSGPIHEFSRVLKPGGRLIILMLHPCFYGDRVSRNAGDYEGPGNAYFQPRKISQRFCVDGITSPAKVTSWHRPLEFYAQSLRDAGFLITDLREPHPSEEQLRNEPWWRANFPQPLFLLIAAQKHDMLLPPRHDR